MSLLLHLSFEEPPEPEVEPWLAMRTALVSWVLAGSGLGIGQVIWARQTGPMPAGPYISLRLLNLGRVSDDWMITEISGDGVRHRIIGTRQPTLELTCFAAPGLDSTSGVAVLDRVLAAIRLPSVRSILAAGNVGIGALGPIRIIDGARSGMLDPRAIVEVGLHTMSEISEPGYAIERVRITGVTGSTSWVPEDPA